MSNSFLAGFAAGMVRGLQTRSPKIIMYTGTYIVVVHCGTSAVQYILPILFCLVVIVDMILNYL